MALCRLSCSILIFLLPVEVRGYASKVTCSRELKVGGSWGSMNGAAVSSSRSVYFKNSDGDVLSCGGTYTPGEVLTAHMSNSGGSRVMELSGGATFREAADCSGLRTTGHGKQLDTPSTGTIKLWAAHAGSCSPVSVTEKCELTPAADPNAPLLPPSSPSPDAPPGAPPDAPAALMPASGGSASTLEGMDYMFSPADAPDGFTVHWALDEDAGLISMAVEAERAGGMLAVGWSSTGEMAGSTAVIGWEGKVRFYELPGYSAGSFVEVEDFLTDVDFAVNDGTSVMRFTRPLEAPSRRRLETLGTEEPVTHLWSVGDSKSLVKHTLRGSFRVDLSGPATGADSLSALPVPRSAVLYLTHAVLMLLSWGLLLPLGVAMALRRPRKGTFWFTVHYYSMLLGLTLALGGWGLAISTHSSFGGDEPWANHGVLGTLVMGLGLAQAAIALLSRPKKGTPNRARWELQHRATGFLATVLAGVTIVMGALRAEELAAQHYPGMPAAIGGVYGAAALVVVCAFVTRLRAAPAWTETQPSASQQGKQPIEVLGAVSCTSSAAVQSSATVEIT
jgi:hypothetical protein